MASTWTLLIPGKAFAATTVMLGVLNAGAKVIRIRRVGMINYQTAAVVGVLCLLDLRRYYTVATWAAPTAVSAIKHDTTNGALDTVTTGHAGTPGGGAGPDIFRRWVWSSDEPVITSGTWDEWECIVPFSVVFNCGYGESECQGIVLRATEAIFVYNTSGAAGLADIYAEFTDT